MSTYYLLGVNKADGQPKQKSTHRTAPKQAFDRPSLSSCCATGSSPPVATNKHRSSIIPRGTTQIPQQIVTQIPDKGFISRIYEIESNNATFSGFSCPGSGTGALMSPTRFIKNLVKTEMESLSAVLPQHSLYYSWQ